MNKLNLFTASVLCLLSAAATFPPPLSYTTDWRWLHGAVFVPTNCVNEAQQWDQYDPAINDRELHYASVYGINCVRVFLHFDIYLKKKQALLDDIEDFLQRADKYGIKTEFVFFDDCWSQPDANILSPTYQYPPPIFGVHNSRWIVSPGENIRQHYEQYKDQLKSYVQDIVSAHKDDRRIAFWETYNEPGNSLETIRLLKDSYQWIHETGTSIPLTATGGGFAGEPYSDFKTFHEYGGYGASAPPDVLCTECMNRAEQSIPGIVNQFHGRNGFIFWEFGIGRDNCRFAWSENRQSPRKDETPKPFHGIVYPDGHPWSIDDVKAILGPEKLANAPLFSVSYFKDANFTQLAKKSVTPMIHFDLGTERGTGSPDASAGVPEQNFSVRWTGTILPAVNGTYTFDLNSDGPVSLYLNSELLLSKQSVGQEEISANSDLPADQPALLKIEYAHTTGDPSLHLFWSGPGFSKQILTPTKLSGFP